MADIENLIAFAENGEKDITGLNQTNGFPAALKPARQWFNFLFNSLSVKINEVIERVNNNSTSLEGITDYFLPVDTIISSFDPDFDPNVKYPGTTWVRHGEGRVPVGLSTQTGDPAWAKTIGSTFGEYTHQLTVDELAKCKPSIRLAHEQGGSQDSTGFPNTNATRWVTHSGSQPDLSECLDDGTGNPLGSIGNDQPHNNVQPSIVEARWRRTA